MPIPGQGIHKVGGSHRKKHYKTIKNQGVGGHEIVRGK